MKSLFSKAIILIAFIAIATSCNNEDIFSDFTEMKQLKDSLEMVYPVEGVNLRIINGNQLVVSFINFEQDVKNIENNKLIAKEVGQITHHFFSKEKLKKGSLFFTIYKNYYVYKYTESIGSYQLWDIAPKQLIQTGDLIFQTSNSSQSKAIQLATNSKYSHMGVIYENDGDYFVFEAINTVCYTAFDNWVSRGNDSHYVIKRLINAEELLSVEALAKLKSVGKQYEGKKYDLYFEWSDERIYCSELVWKMYKEAIGIEIGKLERLSDFDLSDEIVKQKMKERYGNHIPLDEQVISPAAMFRCDKLELIEIK